MSKYTASLILHRIFDHPKSILKTLLLTVAMFAVALGTSSIHGQENTEVLRLTPLDELDSTKRLILSTVRSSDPKTGEALLQAIEVALDLDVYNDARFYIRKLDQLPLDQNQLFALYQKVGSSFFFRIHRVLEVQPEGQPVAKKFLSAARAIAVSPNRIDSLIRQLNSRDPLGRSQAFRYLNQLGEPAVAGLLNTFTDDDKIDLFPGIRAALNNIGDQAQGPMLGGTRAGDLQVRVESIRALAHVNSSEAMDELSWAYLSPKAPRYTRKIASQYLGGFSGDVDVEAVKKRLYRRAFELLGGKTSLPNSVLGSVTLWRWDAAQKKLVPAKLDVETALRIVASRRASDLYEIEPENPKYKELYVLAQLEAAKRAVGASKQVATESMVRRLGLTKQVLIQYLQRAMELDLIPAAVACCEIIGQIGDESILVAGDQGHSVLIDAIMTGDRYLQHAAFQAITKLDPKTDFAGSSYIMSLAIYLAQSENLPAGLVGHRNPAVAQSYAANFVSAGLVGKSSVSSKDFFEEAVADPDIEVLVLTDTLNWPDYVELIHQLRSDWRTKRLPIALLLKDERQSRRIQMRIGDDPRYIAIPFFIDAPNVAAHVRQLRAFTGPWRISNYDRRRHAADALRWLAKIASDRDSYAFYNLGSYESKLTRLMYVPGFADDASQILSRLGTPMSQRELLNFASQSANPVAERKTAVSAFVESISKGGTLLLTSSEIRQQYDRYNASEQEPKESQQILGSILDAIEARIRESN
ncbi:MAG: hypothetical protein AAF939_11255 [Planctomycetota bacterium]